MKPGQLVFSLTLANVLLITGRDRVAAYSGGQDWYLISLEGKLIRKLETKEHDTVDVEARLFYRREGNLLSALSFEDDGVKWTVQVPAGILIPSDRNKLAIVADGILYGYEKRTGREIYRTPLGTPKRLFSLPRNYFPGSDDTDEGGVLYLTHEKAELVKLASNRMERVAVQPPTLAGFALGSGGELWETTLGTNFVIGSVTHGSVSGQPAGVHFDPSTGQLLTNVPAAAQLLYAGRSSFYVSDKQSGTLTAIETRTQKVLWQITGLAELSTILQPYAYDRLLCAAGSRVLVVDALKGRVKCEFSLAGLNNVHFLQYRFDLIAQSNEMMRVIDPETGIARWDLPTASSRHGEIFRSWDNRILIVERTFNQEGQKVRYEVVALGDNRGKPDWRWPVPDGPTGDSVGVKIRRCATGYAVCRHWWVGE